jgi:pimeloyl-ACP methyl ester carboxylesterase
MTAVFAYEYVLGPLREDSPDAYDRRYRVACDLYNFALGKGLATGKEGQLEFRSGVRELPLGKITISLKQVSLQIPLEDFEAFLPAADYVTYGLTVRNRTAGLGLPLVAVHKKRSNIPRGGPSVPVTAFLRFTGYEQDANTGSVSATASLEFYSTDQEADISVGGRKVPLETDSTAPLAYMLNDSSIWSQLGPKRFLSSGQQKPELILTQPYVPGRIPVVFVHGTASSPLWWAEMWNTLRSDPVMRKRFQFWFFMYNSSVPIVISANALRNNLSEQVRKLDPEGKDPALQEMVVIGHSQGGLLAKMTAVRTGDLLRRSLNDLSTDELNLAPEMKQLVIFEPLPFVKRVVFISTPHRGSYLAVFSRNFIRKFVDLPVDVVKLSADFLSLNKGKLKMPEDMEGKIPTSIDDMIPTNPWLIALAELPITPGVAANSIISVKGEGDYHQGDDGVVQYTSAHLEEVESEFIVRSDHSCHGNPLVIEEVRRILVEHLASARATGERRRQLSDLQQDSTQNRNKKIATEITEKD